MVTSLEDFMAEGAGLEVEKVNGKFVRVETIKSFRLIEQASIPETRS